MNNLLIILLVLFGALFVIVPLIERIAKPVDAEQMQKYHRIFGILLGLMVVGMTVRFCMGPVGP